ncbi:MAG: PAS domain-containing protein, partial [Elainellaceae cyanobacterium]
MKISLRSLITVPSVLQMIALTSVIAYVSLHSSRQAVEAIATQLAEKTSLYVVKELDTYVQSAHQLNERYISALASNAVDLQDLDPLHRYLILQFQQYDHLSAVLLGLPTGEFRTIHRAAPQADATALVPDERSALVAGRSEPQSPDVLTFYDVDQTGRFGQKLSTIQNLDVRSRPWYRRAAETGQPGWSGPGHMSISDVIGISAYTPIYSSNDNALQGVITAEISLDRLSAFLHQLDVGATGEVFIMERDGLLVAESTEKGLCLAQDMKNTVTMEACQTFYQRQAVTSTSPAIRAITRHLQDSIENLDSIQSPQHHAMTLNGDRWFLQVLPYSDGRGLDWLIVTAISEADFMADANAALRSAIGLSLLILAVAIALGAWIAQRVARPLVDLNRDIQALERNNLVRSNWSSSTLITEVDLLQSAFYHMASRLRTLLQTLEQQVAARTTTLARREADLKLTQRIARTGGWALNPATGQISWSEELLRIYGLDQLETTPDYSDFLAYLPPEDRNELRLAVERAIAEGVPYEVEHRFIRPRGDVLHMISRGEAILDDQGNLLKLMGTATDISDRKRAELALFRQEELFRQVTETIREVFYVFDLTINRHLYISPAYEEVYGCSVEILYQNPKAWQDVVHPDDRDRVLQEADVTYKFGNLISQYRVVHGDGTIRWIEDKNSPVHDDTGRVCKLIGVAEDITIRKQAELALERRNAQLQQLAVLDSLTQVGNR